MHFLDTFHFTMLALLTSFMKDKYKNNFKNSKKLILSGSIVQTSYKNIMIIFNAEAVFLVACEPSMNEL